MNFPNLLSLLRIILAPVFILMFLSEDTLFIQLSFIIFSIAAITDWYDGWYARRYGFKTKWGRFIDPLADKILTSAAFLAFYLLDETDAGYFGYNEFIPVRILVAIIIARDLILTIMRCVKELKGLAFVTSNLAKTKTFLQMTFIFLFTGLIAAGNAMPSIMPTLKVYLYSPYLYWFLFVVSLLTLITGILYFFERAAPVITNTVPQKTTVHSDLV